MTDTWIDLIRHGEPEGGPRYRGHAIDDPLSEKGWAQMRAAVAGHGDWQRIITSPLRRCRDFATELAGQRGLPMHVEHDLREVGFGRWEGKTKAELIAEDADGFHAFYRDPVHARPAGAEPLDTFARRVAASLDRIAATYTGEHLLVVAHAGVMRAALVHAIAAPPACMYRVNIKNAALLRIRSSDGGYVLEEMNNGWFRRPG